MGAAAVSEFICTLNYYVCVWGGLLGKVLLGSDNYKPNGTKAPGTEGGGQRWRKLGFPSTSTNFRFGLKKLKPAVHLLPFVVLVWHLGD